MNNSVLMAAEPFLYDKVRRPLPDSGIYWDSKTMLPDADGYPILIHIMSPENGSDIWYPL